MSSSVGPVSVVSPIASDSTTSPILGYCSQGGFPCAIFSSLPLVPFFGLGATVASFAAPSYINLPSWAIHWLFWGGIALMALMVFDAPALLIWRPATLTAILATVGFAFLSAAAISHFSPLKDSTAPIDGNLFIACRIAFLPGTIPPEGSINVLTLSPEELAKGGKRAVGGEISGPVGSEIKWLPKSRMDPPPGYRCEIINDTAHTLQNVIIPLRITFSKIDNHEEYSGEWSVVLVRLDPGANNKIVLFLRNLSPQLAYVVPADLGAAFKLGESVNRFLRITKPVDVIDQIVGVTPFIPAVESDR
jgi:hypothetical protein